MSTTLPSEDRRTPPAADHQVPPVIGDRPPVYGSEDAPVLLQLPNLAPASEPTSAEVTEPSDELAPVEAPGEATALPQQADGDDQVDLNDPPSPERQPLRQQRRRRIVSRKHSPGWMNNLGQYVFAVILACVIFAVFVMWKERGEDGATTDATLPPAVPLPSWEDHPAVVLPEVGRNDAQSVWGTSPAAPSSAATGPETAAAEPPGTESRADDATLAPGLGVPDLRLARQPEQAGGAPSRGSPYPDTGVPPLQADDLSKQGAQPDRWGESNRFQPTRQAQRPRSGDQRSR